MHKVGIISGPNYTYKKKAREILLYMYKNFGSYCTIVSGGVEQGPEYWAKRFALEYSMPYKEFNPSYSGHNMYSVMPKSYYGKDWHVSQLFHRYKEMVMYCDKIIIFKEPGVELDEPITYAINWADKCSKKVGIIS